MSNEINIDGQLFRMSITKRPVYFETFRYRMAELKNDLITDIHDLLDNTDDLTLLNNRNVRVLYSCLYYPDVNEAQWNMFNGFIMAYGLMAKQIFNVECLEQDYGNRRLRFNGFKFIIFKQEYRSILCNMKEGK